MVWKAKAKPTSDEVKHAYSLLPPNSLWHLGLIEESGHIQFRGAMHPNYNGPGEHPGVEVWTDILEDQFGYKANPMAEDLGTSSPDEIETVLAAVEATGKGFPRDEVYSTIMIESGWKPHNYFHSSKVPPEKAAGGLIGFMPFVLKNLGWTGTAVEFRKLSTAEQAPWVAKYFANSAPWKYPGDTYVATAAGGYTGKPADVVVYKNDPNKTADAWDLNKIWDINKDEQITVGELRQVLLTRMKKPPTGGQVLTPIPKEPNPDSLLSLEEWLSLLALSMLHDAEKGKLIRLGTEATKIVERYQEVKNLKVDGTIGKFTLRTLT